MKKILLLTACLVTFIGCGLNKAEQNEINKEKQEKQEKLAEQSYGKISELPLGFNFGMTKYEVDELLENLLKNKNISFNGRNYEYKYLTTSDLEIDCELNFNFHNNELYKLTFNITNTNDTNVINTDLNKILDSTYLKTSYYYEDTPNSYITKWFKRNQIIYLRKVIDADLSYINAPIAKIISDKNRNNDLKKILEKIDNTNANVINSSWDSSVSQVKDYLKINLKDYDSYKSIEWSEVQKTETGFMVRHKYRAKNSYDGYVIENQIFYLNNDGVVINVVNYK